MINDTGRGNTDFHCGSIDTNFDPPHFRLDSTFKTVLRELSGFYIVMNICFYGDR
jgi:hypothetical protein